MVSRDLKVYNLDNGFIVVVGEKGRLLYAEGEDGRSYFEVEDGLPKYFPWIRYPPKIESVEIIDRDDFYEALHKMHVNRRSQDKGVLRIIDRIEEE